MSPTYRPDIDGLRAVAVSAIIAFHLAPKTLTGGYLGVDVFFVLSGYLITSIVWNEISAERFVLVKFYEKRIRRIMPALLVVLAVTSVVASLILLPADLMSYGKSMLATLAFMANIYFWRDTNYFARGAEEKPLLHLWSLGVEEQFYVFFPLLIVMLARHWRQGALRSMTLLTLVSLGINTALNVVGGSNPAFFLLPSRAWELGAGSMLPLLPSWLRVGGRRADVLALVGSLLTLGALLGYLLMPDTLPTALPAVGGTTMLIWAGMSAETAVGRILSAVPAVHIGRISYSLYLWHWPVIVFARYVLVRDLAPLEVATAIALMLALASFSLRLVEKPFRQKGMSFRRVGSIVGLASAALAAVGALLVVTNGLPARLQSETAAINAAVGTNYRCPVTAYMSFGASRACTMNLPNRNIVDADVVLFGNSHAQMYAPVISEVLAEFSVKGILVPMNGCLPTVTVNVHPACISMASTNLAEILKLDRVSTVILGLTWEHEKYGLYDSAGRHLTGKLDSALVAGLDDLIARLQASGKRVVLVGPIAYPGWDIASILSRERVFGIAPSRPVEIPRAEFEAKHAEALTRFRVREGLTFVPVHEAQCDTAICRYIIDGESLFSDSSHLAIASLWRFRPGFRAALQDIKKSKDIVK